jgi:hypothetical protein
MISADDIIKADLGDIPDHTNSLYFLIDKLPSRCSLTVPVLFSARDVGAFLPDEMPVILNTLNTGFFLTDKTAGNFQHAR